MFTDVYGVCAARNPPPLPLPKSPKDKELSSSSSPLAYITPESPTKYGRHSRAESMKLDQLYFSRQRAHSPSASMSKLSSSPTVPQSLSCSSSSPHDLSSIADQLNTISTTTTSVLTTLQTLMRRSKDNASELDNLRKQVLESKDKDSQTVDEIKRLLSSANSTTDLTTLYAKLDALRPTSQPTPVPPQPVSTHKLDEEKAVVENILANANQALTYLLTLTESINNLTSHLQTTTTRLSAEESQLEALQERKSTLEAESARLEATIHLRNLELASFTKKAEILESRILRAKTAVQLSGSKHIKMKKSPLIVGPRKPNLQSREAPVTPISSQRRILSLSSTSNKGSPARSVKEFPVSSGVRKTSWSKRIGGMLSGLTSSNNKENAEDSGSVGSVKGGSGSIKSGGMYILEGEGEVTESGVLGLSVPAVAARGRSVSERTK